MKKIILFVVLSFFPFISTDAASISEKLAGRILLNVEENGEAWYVNPDDRKRYYLGRPADAFAIMRELGLGINELDFERIAQAGMPVEGDAEISARLAGRIVLRVQKDGEAWYINPENSRKYYLGRPADAFAIMRELGLGISREDLALIHKPGYDESLDEYSSYEYRKEIRTVSGDFLVDIVKVDLDDPDLSVITDTANDLDCDGNCPSHSLARFVTRNDGFAGVNGTYFNSSSYYYFFPVFNSVTGMMINDDQLKYWTTGPIMAFDDENDFYYFKDSREFGGVSEFEDKYGTKLQAAIGNKPRFIEEGKNLLIDWELDEDQTNRKSWRVALGYKEEESSKGVIYILAARSCTVPDLADIAKSMELDYALNMDGGNSTALFYNDEYMVGPGRNIPNALIFKKDK